MTDNELLALAVKELAAAQEEAKKALAERDAAQEKLDLANRSLQAWHTIVEQKRQATGADPVFMPARPIPPPPEFTEVDALNLTQFVRELLKAAGPNGMTPGEIRSAKRVFGPMAANFPHGILGKLKARGEVENVHGRYVAVEFLDREQSKKSVQTLPKKSWREDPS